MYLGSLLMALGHERRCVFIESGDSITATRSTTILIDAFQIQAQETPNATNTVKMSDLIRKVDRNTLAAEVLQPGRSLFFRSHAVDHLYE